MFAGDIHVRGRPKLEATEHTTKLLKMVFPSYEVSLDDYLGEWIVLVLHPIGPSVWVAPLNQRNNKYATILTEWVEMDPDDFGNLCAE
jgi:hypothetical protein